MDTTLLDTIKTARKADLISLGAHYDIELSSKDKKVQIYNKLISELIELDVLPPEARNEIVEDRETLAHRIRLSELEAERLKIEAETRGEIKKARIGTERDTARAKIDADAQVQRNIAIEKAKIEVESRTEREKAKLEAEKQIELAKITGVKRDDTDIAPEQV